MRDARFNDQVGFDLPDQFPKGDDVLRILADRPAEPGKVVRVLVNGGVQQPVAGLLMQRAVFAQGGDVPGNLEFLLTINR
ncbi:hypothetical protein [Roseibium sp.]|uniref:hypothetical protein n=1 Tax=Roseibium sp. TaxID=1936156 RepID=UPI003BAC2CC4